MISLAMVMRDKLRHRSSKVTFSDRNDPVETFFLHRSYEALRVRIRVRGLIRCLHHANPGLLESFSHGQARLRVPVANQHAARATVRHRKRPHDLSHNVSSGCGVVPSTCTRRVARSMTTPCRTSRDLATSTPQW